MKYKRISTRFFAYITIPLISFAIILSGMFFILLRNFTITYQQNQLIQQAKNISTALASAPDTHMNMGGMGMYLRFLYQSMDEEVWIVDQNYQIITRQRGTITYSSLPEEAKQLVDDVFNGKSSIQDGFNTYLDNQSMTVGTPLLDSSRIVGVVLVHTKLENLSGWMDQGMLLLLVSLLVGLGISFLTSWLLSKHFSKPIVDMSHMTLKMASGENGVTIAYDQPDELGTLANSLNLMAIQLEEAATQRTENERLRKNFIAMVSHELRTPVMVLRGSIESLVDEVVREEDISVYYDKMNRNVLLLQRLIHDLLELTRLDSPDFTFEKNEVNLNQLIEHCLFNAQITGSEKNIHWQVHQETLHSIEGDEDRLSQLFTILLDNAVQYSRVGGNISVEIDAKNRQIRIKDEGEGIHQEDLPYVFYQFYRGKNSSGQGSGLGLALASMIAKVHHLSLEINSIKGQYTEVIIHLEEVL